MSKFAYVELHTTAEMATGAALMRGVVAVVPDQIHTGLTDTGVAFTPCASPRWDTRVHPFDRVCCEHGIPHKLTKPYPPGPRDRLSG